MADRDLAPSSQFGAIAPFYDELMRTVPYRMWVDYYLLLLAHMNVRPKSALDVCCGTGTVAEMLAETDFEITGVDVSETMIEVAREKALEKGFPIRYVCADVSEMDLGLRFDGAYSFFDSLNYISDPERLQSALKRIAAHLPSGATFVFDLNTAYAFEKKMFDQAQLRPHSRLRYEWQGDWDPKSRLIHVHMQFWYGDGEIKETHVQRAYSDEEIRAMLGEAGFEDVKAYHSYTLEKPRKNSDRVHYTAIKS